MERAEHDWPVRALRAQSGPSAITNLAQQDHFGILPHDRTQPGGQVESGRQLTCDWATPAARPRPIFQVTMLRPRPTGPRSRGGGIKRGRLAAAGRARDQDRARVSSSNRPRPCGPRRPVPDRPAARTGNPSEQPHHGLLAMQRGKRAHPHLDRRSEERIRPSWGMSLR